MNKASNNLNSLWSGYFEESLKLSSFRVYITRPKWLNVQKERVQTFFVMHHGAGSCGLSFACLAKEITSLVDGECGILAYDIRGHGDSDDILKDGKMDLRLDELCKDFVLMLELVREYLGYKETMEIILVGHSLGGAVLTYVAKERLVPGIIGCVVLDIVEGSVISSFSKMTYYFSKRPKAFDTIEECIDWHLKNKVVKNEQSLRISVPMLLKKLPVQNATHGKWIWRVNLSETQPFWLNWFSGLSECFLAIPTPKLLVLSNTDRLDKTLMIAQMQGKFQLVTIHDTGHFLHEDEPKVTAKTLITFWRRNQKHLPIKKT
ncbi:carboxylesterase-mitochondrial 37S ribosomal protein YmS2 [Pneumocystis jirovecii RU7]|nr:carboxylesterase-mitochondrial 37S ribosomal protein YmS2 [Pneumocystis jirovecii RU7]KTW26917.1 hypothetical protein T551_03379 [Pneumocystis jirovecii RU7]